MTTPYVINDSGGFVSVALDGRSVLGRFSRKLDEPGVRVNDTSNL